MKCIPLLIRSLNLLLILFIFSSCSSKTPKKNTISQSTASSRSVEVRSSDVETDVSAVDQEKYKKALTYLQSSDLIKAETLLREISSKYPQMSGPYINLGIIAMKEGRWEEAVSLLTSAKSSNPNNPVVFNHLGVIYRQQGRFDEAKDAYQTAIEQDRNFSSAYLNLGILYDLYLSDYAMAKTYYQQYQELKPNDENVKTWLIDLDQRIQASN